jgi:SAM-dependent methyltransferase
MIQELSDTEYLRQRISPVHGDRDYLHLSDLLLGLKALIPRTVTRVLDYGCGGSPYRHLFGPCTYDRADLAGGPALNFEYGADSHLPCEASGYDCVLSSQVLEHVVSPDVYLAECYRVLKPNGFLLLSTHGLYEDHACPDDFWRWTAYGLQRLIEEAGFEIDRLVKLTTGPRAAMFLVERELHRLRFDGRGLYTHLLKQGARIVRRGGARRRHEACDASFPQHRMVDVDQNGHDMYIALALVARRSSTNL